MPSSKSDCTSPDDKISSLEKKVVDLQKENESLRTHLLEVNKERIEYLQNVAHQIVAPLNAMKWHIENITSARVGVDRAKKVLRSIYSQATLAVHLAKNFNLMSNLEADHTLTVSREPLEPVEVKRLLINLSDDFQPLGWDKSINIRVNDSSFCGIPDILVIKPLISQVFSNIIENAVKYSTKGSTINITGHHSSEQNTVSITISNQGIPINASEIKNIFNRGYRSEAAQKSYPAGTGFGLYIAKKIVEIHEGTINASSREGGWTDFEVVLYVRKLEGKAKQWGKKQSY